MTEKGTKPTGRGQGEATYTSHWVVGEARSALVAPATQRNQKQP
jgi:hypothetical protein